MQRLDYDKLDMDTNKPDLSARSATELSKYSQRLVNNNKLAIDKTLTMLFGTSSKEIMIFLKKILPLQTEIRKWWPPFKNCGNTIMSPSQ
jgi:hypothetical protein